MGALLLMWVIVFIIIGLVIIAYIDFRKIRRDEVLRKKHSSLIKLYYVIFAIVIFIGVRHLNPLRWPDRAIRVIVLNVFTPVGMTWDEVNQRVDSIPGWRINRPDIPITPGEGIPANRLNRSSPYYVRWPEGADILVGSTGRRGYIGSYHIMFIAKVHVYPFWLFDENGILIDVSIGRRLQI